MRKGFGKYFLSLFYLDLFTVYLKAQIWYEKK